MNKQLTNQLFEKYKKLFPNGSDVDPRENLMCFGFDCGDGWYKIIDDMCDVIQRNMKKDSTIIFVQIKEKFGQLRVYIENVSDDICDLVELAVYKAEQCSGHICETCGSESKLKNKNGWLSTVCDNCKYKED